MCTFLHADFKGVELNVARQYVHFTRKGIQESFFFIYEEEEDDEVLPVSELPLLEEQRVCGVEIQDLSCLASGHDLNLTYEDIANLWCKGIAVGDND